MAAKQPLTDWLLFPSQKKFDNPMASCIDFIGTIPLSGLLKRINSFFILLSYTFRKKSSVLLYSRAVKNSITERCKSFAGLRDKKGIRIELG